MVNLYKGGLFSEATGGTSHIAGSTRCPHPAGGSAPTVAVDVPVTGAALAPAPPPMMGHAGLRSGSRIGGSPATGWLPASLVSLCASIPAQGHRWLLSRQVARWQVCAFPCLAPSCSGRTGPPSPEWDNCGLRTRPGLQLWGELTGGRDLASPRPALGSTPWKQNPPEYHGCLLHCSAPDAGGS